MWQKKPNQNSYSTLLNHFVIATCQNVEQIKRFEHLQQDTFNLNYIWLMLWLYKLFYLCWKQLYTL